MKLKCINNTEQVTSGFVSKKTTTKIIKGLTLGKIYVGSPVSIVDIIPHGTSINLDDIYFLIYDDHKEWNAYSLDLFEPKD